MLKPEKIKSCAADRDEGGRRDVFSVYPVYIRFSSGEIRDEGVGSGRRKNEKRERWGSLRWALIGWRELDCRKFGR